MTEGPTAIAAEVTLLRRAAAPTAPLVAAIEAIAARAPFRHLATPNGGTMSVAMTNCGPWGWHSDASGYRYTECDPLTGEPWPAMPARFRSLARDLAARGGFAGFEPDACLVNRYAPGARMGAHRDWDELDKRFPIVSVSIGLPAIFLWYGPAGAPGRSRRWSRMATSSSGAGTRAAAITGCASLPTACIP